MTCFLGVDPGVSGAIACIQAGPNGVEVQVSDAPTIETRGTRREYMLPEMRRLLHAAIERATYVFAIVEDVNPMPREGVVSAGAFMRGIGLWEGLLCGLGIPYSKVRPQVWKKEFGIALPPSSAPKLGMKRDLKAQEAERRKRQIDQKARAIIVAQRLFPTMSLARKKDHGRAEALLIAEFCRRQYSGQVNPKALRPE